MPTAHDSKSEAPKSRHQSPTASSRNPGLWPQGYPPERSCRVTRSIAAAGQPALRSTPAGPACEHVTGAGGCELCHPPHLRGRGGAFNVGESSTPMEAPGSAPSNGNCDRAELARRRTCSRFVTYEVILTLTCRPDRLRRTFMFSKCTFPSTPCAASIMLSWNPSPDPAAVRYTQVVKLPLCTWVESSHPCGPWPAHGKAGLPLPWKWSSACEACSVWPKGTSWVRPAQH